MTQSFQIYQREALAAVAAAETREQLEAARVEFLGRKGRLAELMAQMAGLADEERRLAGAAANEAKQAVGAAFEERAAAFERAESSERLARERIDVTEPPLAARPSGCLHPVTQVREDLEDLFSSMGFVVADGPQLESDYFNFTALNIPPTHPARDMQDTFYVVGGKSKEPRTKNEGEKNSKDGDETKWVMRTHTSPVQVRAMRRYGVPLRLVAPGRCFRNEATDVRHEHTFHQLEGVVVDRGITLGHMKGVLETVARHLYGPETRIRLRPKFYPFVEPGVNGEVTCFLCKGGGCRLCKKSGWLEVFGAGMIHPNVLREGGADPDVYSGFAFGFGLTRLVMLKYGIDDIRHIEGGDLRFLKQF